MKVQYAKKLTNTSTFDNDEKWKALRKKFEILFALKRCLRGRRRDVVFIKS